MFTNFGEWNRVAGWKAQFDATASTVQAACHPMKVLLNYMQKPYLLVLSTTFYLFYDLVISK